jgi:hypothetical protein
MDEMQYQMIGLVFPFRNKLIEQLVLGKQIHILEGPTQLLAEGEIIFISE